MEVALERQRNVYSTLTTQIKMEEGTIGRNYPFRTTLPSSLCELCVSDRRLGVYATKETLTSHEC